MTFSKKIHSTPLHPLHLPIQNILLAVNPFHCFLQKASGPGKIVGQKFLLGMLGYAVWVRVWFRVWSMG